MTTESMILRVLLRFYMAVHPDTNPEFLNALRYLACVGRQRNASGIKYSLVIAELMARKAKAVKMLKARKRGQKSAH